MLSSRDMPRVTMRLPDEFKVAIEKLAEKNHRSVSGEYLAAIENHINRNSEAPATCDSQGL